MKIVNIDAYKAKRSNVAKTLVDAEFKDATVRSSNIDVVLYATDDRDPVILVCGVKKSEVYATKPTDWRYWQQVIQQWQIVVHPELYFSPESQQFFCEDLVRLLPTIKEWPEIDELLKSEKPGVTHVVLEFERENIESPNQVLLHKTDKVILSEDELNELLK